MSEKKVVNKYCLVPDCPNTSKNAPEKWFITVPSDIKIRKVWQTAMRREVFVSNKSHVYCCEDHFKIKTEEDGDNVEKEESDYEPALTDNANEFVVKEETIETAPKRKVTEVTATGKRLKKSKDCSQLNEILKKTSPADSISQDQSECQIFGNLVAKKLAKYSWELQSNVEQDIMNVLFKADRIHLNQTFNDLGISDHSTSSRSTPVTSLQHQLDVSDIELQDL